MKFSDVLALRRIFNHSYHPFRVIPKPSIWSSRERLKRLVAWQYGTSRDCVKAAYRQLNKVFIYMDMERQDRHKLEYYYAGERLDSALKEHYHDYPNFKRMLNTAHIVIDKRILAQLALYEPRTFKSLVELTQKMSQENGQSVYSTEAELDHVLIDSSLFEEPFARATVFPSGPAKNHSVKARLLKEKEF